MITGLEHCTAPRGASIDIIITGYYIACRYFIQLAVQGWSPLRPLQASRSYLGNAGKIRLIRMLLRTACIIESDFEGTTKSLGLSLST